MPLYDKLREYVAKETYPMHMPGHKRNPAFIMENPYEWDVTEVEGTDNLHHPEGIIREEMNWVKEIYQTEETYFLVNGSTCGILAAISACCRRGDTILVARNCHRAVYHAVFLLELNPIYLYPEVDEETGILLGIAKEQVEKKLSEAVSCVVITSPTYEGVVSDVDNIASIVHNYNIPLIVDAAHGAHFSWSKKMPTTPMKQGADIVVESLHKTLPSLTQTALLHQVSKRVPKKELERYLAIYETSSPSYVLMASISRCLHYLAEEGERPWDEYEKNLTMLKEKAENWRCLRLWTHPDKEPSKQVIWTGNTEKTGVELAEELRNSYQIEVEMAARDYIIAMTSIADSREGFLRLANALSCIDKKLSLQETKPGNIIPEANVKKCCYEAVYGKKERIWIEEAKGRVSAEYAFFYPPGIPFLVPGEEITEEIILSFVEGKRCGLTLLGLEDEKIETIMVCKEEK